MKVAVDLDGVFLDHPEFFKLIFIVCRALNHPVGILTGRVNTEEFDLEILKEHGIIPNFYIGRKNKDELVGAFKRKAIIENKIDVLIDDFGENNKDIEQTFFSKELPENLLILKVINMDKIKEKAEREPINTVYSTSNICPKCGKPYWYIGDVPKDGFPKGQEPYCTCGRENNSFPSLKEETVIPQGWLCPRCGRINAPFVKQCPCSEPKIIFNVSGS